MKLTCPECFSEFDVPDTYIGTTGRRVRCGSCQNIWFQAPVVEDVTPTDDAFDLDVQMPDVQPATPDLNDVVANVAEQINATQTDDVKPFTRFDDGMPFEPIPPSLHPAQDDELTHTSSRKTLLLNKAYLLRLLAGFVVAAAVFALLLWLGALADLHKGSLRAFYKPFGIVASPVSMTLTVAEAQAEIVDSADGSQKTRIKATLLNTGEEKVHIPLIEMSIMTASGAPSDSVYIKPEDSTLPAGKTLDIEATLPSAITENESIRIRFVGN